MRFARAQLRRPGVLSPVHPTSPRPGTLTYAAAYNLRFIVTLVPTYLKPLLLTKEYPENFP